MNLSILIPTYNRSKLLKRCLQSVLIQLGSFEVVIVDDASTDDTEETVLSFVDSRIVYIKQAHNQGVNSARNKGILNSKKEWIFCLDDDDELIPESIKVIESRISEMPLEYNVAYFNSKIIREEKTFIGGFQFGGGINFFDPSYEQTMTKFNLKGDCKPAFRRILFDNQKYKFPETINGFESYTMNLLARDKKGLRYFNEIVTLIHQENFLTDRLSIKAPKKNPWPLFVLHLRQIPQHLSFYIKNPLFFYEKIKTMIKLFIRSIIALLGVRF